MKPRKRRTGASERREPLHRENLGDEIVQLLDLITCQVRAASDITMAANNPPPMPENAPAHLGVIALSLRGHLAGLVEIEDRLKHLRGEI
jgi:hypothetical protein